MLKKEYIIFHLITVLTLQKNEEAKKYIEKHVQGFTDEQIDNYYLAVTGRSNISELKKLYENAFQKELVKSLTPSQQAILWQGKFEYGNLVTGYVQRDQYKDVEITKGQHLYALVADAANNSIPDYFFPESELKNIQSSEVMEVYALLQLNPFWIGGYGARTVINKYIVEKTFDGAQGYALKNHHLSREFFSDERLSEKDKKKRGIGKGHIESETHDECDCRYEYIVPPCAQVFVPRESKSCVKLREKEVSRLQGDMIGYENLYEEYIIKAQKDIMYQLSVRYENNKRLDPQLP